MFKVRLQDKLQALEHTMPNPTKSRRAQSQTKTPASTALDRNTVVKNANDFVTRVSQRFGKTSSTYTGLLRALTAYRRAEIDGTRLYVNVFLLFRASQAVEWFQQFERYLPPAWQKPPLTWLHEAIAKYAAPYEVALQEQAAAKKLAMAQMPPPPSPVTKDVSAQPNAIRPVGRTRFGVSLRPSARANGPVNVPIKTRSDNKRKRRVDDVQQDLKEPDTDASDQKPKKQPRHGWKASQDVQESTSPKPKTRKDKARSPVSSYSVDLQNARVRALGLGLRDRTPK